MPRQKQQAEKAQVKKAVKKTAEVKELKPRVPRKKKTEVPTMSPSQKKKWDRRNKNLNRANAGK
jgi:predicted RecB family endonuclease